MKGGSAAERVVGIELDSGNGTMHAPQSRTGDSKGSIPFLFVVTNQNDGDLKGTYVFSSSGTDSAGDFLMVLGALADGNGNITGGNVDINGADIDVATAQITGGSYQVEGDGRGTLTLNATSLPSGSMMFDFALATNQGGVITEFDSNGTGSGTLDLQSNATLSGSYAFNLVGGDSGGSRVASGFVQSGGRWQDHQHRNRGLQ